MCHKMSILIEVHVNKKTILAIVVGKSDRGVFQIRRLRNENLRVRY